MENSREVCVACGAACCKAPYYLSLIPKEILRLREISPGIRARFLKGQWRVLFSDHDDRCPHLGSDNLCKIYPVRPKACRTFPEPEPSPSSANCPLWKKRYR